MLRKLVYNGTEKFRVIYPIDLMVEKGVEVVVEDKLTAEQLEELGFKEVAQGKKEIQKDEKEGDK